MVLPIASQGKYWANIFYDAYEIYVFAKLSVHPFGLERMSFAAKFFDYL
jgi:hypothetical protein